MLLVPMLAVVTLSLSDASTTQLRTVPQGNATAVDVHTVPMSRLNFRLRRSELTLFYAPDFAWLDITRDVDFALMHRAGISETWTRRRLRLSASVLGAIGHESYLTGAAPPATTASGAPPATGLDPARPGEAQGMQAMNAAYFPARSVLKTTYLRETLSLGYRLTARWNLAAVLAYEVAGGLGGSERYLPLRRGPTGSLSVTYAMTRRDDLTSTVSGFLTDVPKRDGRFVGATALETWQHRFAPLTSSSLGAGGTYLWSRPQSGAAEQKSLLGTGLASFLHGVQVDDRTMLSFGVSSTLAATYNPILGAVGQQLSETAIVGFRRDRTTLSAGAQSSQSLPFGAANATRTVGASAMGSYQLADPVLFSVGGNWSHQVLPDNLPFALAAADQWQVYASVRLAAPPITF